MAITEIKAKSCLIPNMSQCYHTLCLLQRIALLIKEANKIKVSIFLSGIELQFLTPEIALTDFLFIACVNEKRFCKDGTPRKDAKILRGTCTYDAKLC